MTEGQKEVEGRGGVFSPPFGMNKRELLSLIHQNKTPPLQGNFVTGIFLIKSIALHILIILRLITAIVVTSVPSF